MLSVLHSHACWCPGDFRSQGIRRHGIYPQSWNVPSPAPEGLIHNIHTFSCHPQLPIGPCFKIKIVFPGTRIHIIKIWLPRDCLTQYLYNRNSYTGKMAYWKTPCFFTLFSHDLQCRLSLSCKIVLFDITCCTHRSRSTMCFRFIPPEWLLLLMVPIGQLTHWPLGDLNKIFW